MEATTQRPQHLAALDRANELRLAACALKRETKALPYHEGLLRLAELLADPPEPMQRVRVDRVLCWPWRMGRESARRYLSETGLAPVALRCIGPSSRLGRRPLTEAQRHRLAAYLCEAASRAKTRRR